MNQKIATTEDNTIAQDDILLVVLDGTIGVKYPYNTNVLNTGEAVTSLALLGTASVTAQLSNWFNENLKQYSTYLTKSSYCSDTQFNLVNNIDF